MSFSNGHYHPIRLMGFSWSRLGEIRLEIQLPDWISLPPIPLIWQPTPSPSRSPPSCVLKKTQGVVQRIFPFFLGNSLVYRYTHTMSVSFSSISREWTVFCFVVWVNRVQNQWSITNRDCQNKKIRHSSPPSPPPQKKKMGKKNKFMERKWIGIPDPMYISSIIIIIM